MNSQELNLLRRRGASFAVALLALCAALISNVYAATTLASARLWPAPEYTRLVLESSTPIVHTFMSLRNPERLVLDLENVTFDAALAELPAKHDAADPYVRAVRVARYKPRVVRVVLDLKTVAEANVFTLAPFAGFAYRLVVDIYPVTPYDPLMALLHTERSLGGAHAEERAPAAESQAGTPPPAHDQPVPAPDATQAATGKNEAGATAGATGSDGSTQIADSPITNAPAAATPESTQPAPSERRASAPPEDGQPEARTDGRAKPAMDRLVVVAVDAGHGGEDPGARGRRGSREKDVTLAIARRLKREIDAQPNMRAVLIRDGDYYIALRDRVEKARRVRADLFVSIHADAFFHPHVRGSSVFALSEQGASSVAARWLARQENQADLIGGVNLRRKDPLLARTLLDLSQTATINDSLKLAKAVLSEIGNLNTLHKRSVQQAGFAVLKAPDIPSILVETAFISNPHEERRLVNAAYQEKMAEAIVTGIKRYLGINPKSKRAQLALAD